MKKSLLLFLCLLLLTGCGGSGGSDSKKSEADTERWNSYVVVSNSLDKVDKALEAYLEAFGDSAQYQQTTKTTSFTNNMNSSSTDKFGKDIDKALELSKKDSTELGKATTALLTPAKELWANLAEAADYYKNKNYVDDNYAKAKTLHEKIIAIYPSYDDNLPAFNDLMDKQNRELRKSDIKEMKADGRALMATMLEAIDAAQTMQDILYEQNITSENLQSLSMDKFRPAYDEYVKYLNEFEKLSKDEKLVKEEKLEGYSISSLLNALKSVKTSAAGLIERHQQNKKAPFSPSMTTGTPEHFDRQMDALIARYNQAIGVK